MIKKILIMIMASILILPVSNVKADSTKYLVLGKDLSTSEKKKVLELLDVENENDYNVSYITHDDEIKYLSSYISKSAIGSRALSSVVMEERDKNEGIKVTTQNITYVTEKMYQNALITAGVKDIELKVAGPFKISGTAALVAATKSYSIMTGEELDEKKVDAANNEIVVTSELAKETNKEDAANLVATLKQKVASEGSSYTREKGEKAIDEVAKQMNITISADIKIQLLNLMDKFSKADLNVDAIKTQAKNIYNDVKGYLNNLNDSGFFTKIKNGFNWLIKKIISFFS